MPSKKSFFNKTVFRKNLTRFAPVWVIYTICLVAGLALTYTNYAGDRRMFWFPVNFAEDIPVYLGVVNLIYALIVAQLLFGDLYNSRMCNALHALPLQRESWFVTNFLSGLTFSFGPTLVMVLLALPLLSRTIVTDAWLLSPLVLVLSNLEFLCFFGIAVFCTMCVGSRFTMIAGYGLMNFGAYIAYWLVDRIYTPLLYGVITPVQLAANLTPVNHMTGYTFFTPEHAYHELAEIMNTTGAALTELSTGYTLTEHWWRLFACGGAGLVLAGLALVLYRRRHLECAGDAVAFRALLPVFQVLCSLFVMTAAHFVTREMLGLRTLNYPILAVGLIIGWFVGKMLIERSTRVFQPRNLIGLGALAAVLALSLICTHFDILGIETWLPRAEKVASVVCNTYYSRGIVTVQEPEDIAAMIRLQELALEDRPEGEGLHVRGWDGSWIYAIDTNEGLYDATQEKPEFTYATSVELCYTLHSGREIRRRYNIWTETGAGLIIREYLNDWSLIRDESIDENGQAFSRLDHILKDFEMMRVMDYGLNQEHLITDKAEALSFLEAVKADCEAGTMAQNENFHKSCFRETTPEEWSEEEYYEAHSSVHVSIRSKMESWSVQVYPDSAHCVQWLRERGMLNMDIEENTCPYWSAEQEMIKESVF